jgi:hypothetical protein
VSVAAVRGSSHAGSRQGGAGAEAGERPVVVLACGALAAEIHAIARRRGLAIELRPLPALLHNRPERIAPALERELLSLAEEGRRVAVAYGDCGSRGEIDALLRVHGVERLRAGDCYELFAGEALREELEREPGTYLLSDFLARTFEHTVIRQLGLDRHPELRELYFRHYRRVLWLAQRPTPATRAAAERAAARLQLPLEVRRVGCGQLEGELERLLATAA